MHTLNRPLALICALLTLAGCCRRQNTEGAHVIVALDRSDSTIERRGEMLSTLDDLAGDADAEKATLDIWAFDTQPVRIWGPTRSEGAKPLLEVKGLELRPRPEHPRRGTRPGLLFQALSLDRTTHSLAGDKPVRVVILTDGGIDHADDPALLRSAAHRLAQEHRNLVVLVIGIESQERRIWERVVGEEIPQFKAITWSEASTELKQLDLGGAK